MVGSICHRNRASAAECRRVAIQSIGAHRLLRAAIVDDLLDYIYGKDGQ